MQPKSKHPSNQKLWRIVNTLDGYFYEIKLAGMVVDRIPVEEKSLNYLKIEGVI